MQTELTVVQAFWNLELIPIRKISSQASVFLPCPSLPCVSVAQISTLEGGYVSAIAKYSGTFSYPSLGISNPNREKPTCYRIAWHPWSTWMIHGSDWLKPSGLSQGSRFLRTTEVTRGNDGDMMAHPHFHALLLVKPSYFKGQGYINRVIGSKCGRKLLGADYLPSVNVKAVKATFGRKRT